MAYGKGDNKDKLKRMAEGGQAVMSGELIALRAACLAALETYAARVFPDTLARERPSGRDLDALMLEVQKDIRASGLNSVWAEKMRLMAKSAIAEQWKRGQKTLFGRLKHIASPGREPDAGGNLVFVNLPEGFRDLPEAERRALQDLADSLDFRQAMALFRDILEDRSSLPAGRQALLRALLAGVEARFGRPEWKEDAVLQLTLDGRCVRGETPALDRAKARLTEALRAGGSADVAFEVSASRAHGPAIQVQACLPLAVSRRMRDGRSSVGVLVLELGPETMRTRIVTVREPSAPDVFVPGAAPVTTVVAEDFGFAKTSSLVVLRAKTPVSPERLAMVAGQNLKGEDTPPKMGKAETHEYLTSHVSDDAEVEVLARVQMDGRPFLARVRERCLEIDCLRSEIDRGYNRLERIRAEINRMLGREATELIDETAPSLTLPPKEAKRLIDMHGRFFRLLDGLNRLKSKRRAVCRSIDGLKRSWFGFVSTAKADLAEAHGAVAIREDLTVLAIPTDDPGYRGRTFNKMMNNGSKGQYIRRSDAKLAWRGIARIVLPSYYSSVTDWRTGTVDKGQRKKTDTFRGSDGRTWDADLHAAEMLARWLFLKPKPLPATL